MLEIRNANLFGKIVSIIISKGKIASIGDPTTTVPFLDASGLIVLPGLINLHVHFRQPGGGHKENWLHGSLAALMGGATLVGDMPNTKIPLNNPDKLGQKVELIGNVPIDYRLWYGATPNNIATIPEIAWHPRIIGVKIYACPSTDTDELWIPDIDTHRKVFTMCADNGLPVAEHCENPELMERNRLRIKAALGIEHHCVIRDTEVETSGVDIALQVQEETGCELLLCHLSAPESIEKAYTAKQKGAKVYVEVCPHHWLLSEEKLLAPDGAKYKMNPALRTREQILRTQELICRNDYVDCLASDHAPHTVSEKNSSDYDNIPSGLPGIQELLSLAYKFVDEGRMSLRRLADLTSGNAAKIFNLNSKGTIEVGKDADLVLFDPNRRTILKDEDMKSECRWTAYHGMKVPGMPVITIVGGKVYNLSEL